jgi:hypothetical protein
MIFLYCSHLEKIAAQHNAWSPFSTRLRSLPETEEEGLGNMPTSTQRSATYKVIVRYSETTMLTMLENVYTLYWQWTTPLQVYTGR